MKTLPCHECPLRRNDMFIPFSDEELAFMERFKIGELTVDSGTSILAEGTGSPQLFTVLKGMGLRFKILPNGNRQVINFLLPGDFIGLQAGLMGEMTHSVESTTPMTLCVFRRQDFWSLFAEQPERGFDVTWLAAVEEYLLGESLTSLGQRSAEERLAWALLAMHRRLTALGLGNGATVPMPYRQQDLADALGLSLVHTNKTLARLRSRQLVSWQAGKLTVPDVNALAKVAMLELAPLPRRPLL